ncbi:protease modulator HflK [Sphingomonas sp. 28-63-12]|uniref:protease modulator HflK n=1 Tax=Sphingomonas sp. 28-63-12 TaxID=1970434 RepID=UPI000BD5838D|nr:MAG: protease modulator HflK [Sphingomonas sp. 28-63-12]
MINTPAWLQRFSTLMTEKPKSPWGNSGDDNEGPRNPWSVPPGGNRPRGVKPTALDEFIRRARGTGGGGGGSGFTGFPTGGGGRAIWLIGSALIVALWVIFTSVHQIAPQQRGVVAFFGRYSETLDPGIRLTWPAPIATVAKVDVQAIRTEDFPEGGTGENLMLTGDQNIIDLAYSVRWDIANPQDYIYQIRNPKETVRAVAESAMRAVVATVTLDEAIGSGRDRIGVRAQDLMQSILTEYNAGIRIQGIAIKQADPPSKVIDEFKKVSAAQQEAESNLNEARTYAQQITARAQAEATQFDLAYAQYKLAPVVTRRRMYYETMEAVLAKTNKTIVETGGVVPYLPLPGLRAKPEAAAPVALPNPATEVSQ